MPPCVRLVVVMLGTSALERLHASTDIASLFFSTDVIPALVQPPVDKSSLKVSSHIRCGMKTAAAKVVVSLADLFGSSFFYCWRN